MKELSHAEEALQGLIVDIFLGNWYLKDTFFAQDINFMDNKEKNQ